MDTNNTNKNYAPVADDREPSLSDRFCQFMGIDPLDKGISTDVQHPFELFSLYDHSKYEVHTYSNVEQILSVK